nr:hypothetical protein [Chitinophagaceae bacterium]
MKRVFSKALRMAALFTMLLAPGITQPLVAQPYVEVYLDHLLRPVKGHAAFSRVERLYHTADSGWRAHRFIYPGMVPDALYYLDDTATRRRNGPYCSYYSGSAEAPGRLRQQCFYMADT